MQHVPIGLIFLAVVASSASGVAYRRIQYYLQNPAALGLPFWCHSGGGQLFLGALALTNSVMILLCLYLGFGLAEWWVLAIVIVAALTAAFLPLTTSAPLPAIFLYSTVAILSCLTSWFVEL
jgi:hypothetical protein